MKVRLFVKPHCGWCHKAQAWLEQRGFQYEALNVVADPKALEEMVRLSGQTYAPVLEMGGRVLADFGPEELPAFFQNHQA